MTEGWLSSYKIRIGKIHVCMFSIHTDIQMCHNMFMYMLLFLFLV